MKRVFWFILFLAFFIFWCSTPLFSRNFSSQKFEDVSSQRLFNNDVERQQRVQRRWNGNFCITNWGVFGSMTRDYYESVGCLFCDHPADPNYPAESFEFRSGSDLEYLFQGGIWIGAIVNEETLVTAGWDGWQWIYEMAPGGDGDIIERERPYGGQECIAVYYDTAVPPPLSPWPVPMDWDCREHIPLNLKITQHSYSWDTSGYDGFVILHFTIENLGSDLIEKAYVGLFMDFDIWYFNKSPYGYDPPPWWDDITGYLKKWKIAPGDSVEVNIAWAADNDGDPIWYEGAFAKRSPMAVIGLKLLESSIPSPKISYNWWISSPPGAPHDWGPWLASNRKKWKSINPYGSDGHFPNNALGTPGGDRSKYFMMSNGEIDYDQIFSAQDRTSEGWLPPSVIAKDLADGYDIRFLFSFGPFDIPPDDSIFAVIAVVAGDSFHTNPTNRKNLPLNPDEYYKNLNFSDLVNNALAAQRLYDCNLRFPIPPSDFNVEKITHRTISLSWTAIKDRGITGYNLYRRLEGESYVDLLIYVEQPAYDVINFTDSELDIYQRYSYVVTSISSLGESEPSFEVSAMPGRIALNQNYPNPFNLTTTIPFYTNCKGQEARGKSPTHTTLIIYNILGQKVRTLVDKPEEPGKYTVIWDGKDDSGKEVSSGIYFFRLKVGEYSEVKKMLLLK